MELNNICPICLRTDRKLKIIPIALSEYHEKITDDTLPFKNYHYCSDCDCLLRKTYNFQQKCTNAAKILENWMNATTTDKPSANMLHLKLPPITLDIWKSTNYKLFDITYAYSLEDPINIEDCIAINPDIDTGTGLNMSEKLNSNEKNDEIKNVETLKQHEKTFKMEFLNEQYQTTEASDTSFQNFNDVKKIFTIGSEDPINVVKNELLHEDTKDDTIVNTEIADILKIEYNTTNEFENKLSDETEQVNNTCNIDNVEVKREARKPYNKINLYDTIDINQENHSVSHMLNETYINLPNLADDTPKLNENMDRLTNVSINKTLINYTEVKDLDLICLSDEYNKNDNIIEIDDKNEYPDDASLDSNDDCDDYLHSPPKKTIKKKITLDKLANTDLSDEDLDENYESNINKITHGSRKEKSIISMNKFISTERSLISKLEHMDKTLDSICENWEVTSLFIDKGNTGEQSKDEIKKMTHTFLTRQLLHPRKKNAQGVYVQVGCMNTDLDFIIERCSGTVEDCQDQCSPKERLKTMLKKLPTEDGVALDKDSIIDKLDTVRLSTIKRLLKVMRGKKRLSPDVVKILTNIQNKNVLNKYKSVFDIEHLSTDKEKLEEFERRKTYECYVKAEFKCELCYQGFKTKNHLEYHEKQNHDEMGEFSCRICHVKRKLKKSINTHMTSHCAVYKCKLCPLITHYRDSMINHYEQHKGAIYECDKCFSTYKSKSTLLSHKSIVHSSNNHICTICSGNYYSEDGLKKHMMQKHQGHRNESSEPADVTSVSCEECTINFSSIEAYNKHRSEAHKMTARQNRNPKRTCRVCNMTKSGSAWLKYHYNKMHPDVDFKLQYEKRKEFLCDICGAVYYSQMGLRDHKSRHTGEHRFACDLCPKQFRVAVYLSNHRLYHFPPALVCQHCGKKFHTKSNLFNHLRGHERTVRSHKCQYCQKGFFNIYTLNEHVRGVHYNVRRVRKRGRQETDATGAAGKRSVRAVAKRVKKNASTDESSTDDPSIDECSN